MVSCFDGLPFVSEKLPEESKKVFLKGTMENFAEQMKQLMLMQGFNVQVKLLPIRKTIVGGLPAYEPDFIIGPAKGKANLVLYGGRGVWSLTLQSTVKNQTAFFSSLEILKDENAEAAY